MENLDLSEGGHCYSDMHEDLSDDYHVYALEWEVDSFRCVCVCVCVLVGVCVSLYVCACVSV